MNSHRTFSIPFGNYRPYRIGSAWVMAFILSVNCSSSALAQNEQPSLAKDSPNSLASEHNNHLELGNPSNASSDASKTRNYLVEHEQYVMSYNDKKKIPNWVSWKLDSYWLGSHTRKQMRAKYGPGKTKDPFARDPLLPDTFTAIATNDYNGVGAVGLQRGHMYPSADRSRTLEDMRDTCLMTNLLPQAGSVNMGPWGSFEDHLRKVVEEGHDIYVISGGYGVKEWFNDYIAVPLRVWKIAVILPPDSGLDDVKKSTQIIAVDMPNSKLLKSKKVPWEDFVTSVRALEAHTKFKFLSNVPEDVQDAIEMKCFGDQCKVDENATD